MKYFVYFSWSGNGDFIANYLKEKGYQRSAALARPVLSRRRAQ